MAPEICIEVMSTSNTKKAMGEKRVPYRDLAAEEVWVVGEEGEIRFFGKQEQETSQIASHRPDEVQVR
jgi:Uma2 family endonuclease